MNVAEIKELAKSLTRPVLAIILAIGWVFVFILKVESPWIWVYHIVTVIMIAEYWSERGFMRFMDLLAKWRNRKNGSTEGG